MEIKVRNVEPAAVKKIDELAKSKNMSRQVFLKMYLERLSVLDIEVENQKKLTEAVKKFSQLAEMILVQIKDLQEQQKKLAFTLQMATGVEPKDTELMEQFYNDFASK